jgi:AraC-like DNA-binding protein
LARDFVGVVGVLRDLAPLCDYRASALAGGLQLSLRHLQRTFATTIGCAPREWLQQQRMLAARQLLVKHRSIKQTAYSLGFPSPSQFSRDFRSQFGMTPTSFRRESRSRIASLLGPGHHPFEVPR